MPVDIDRLRKDINECAAFVVVDKRMLAALDELEQCRKERDEAKEMVAALEGSVGAMSTW